MTPPKPNLLGSLRSQSRRLRRFARRANVATALVWCLPALILGIILRGYLLFHHPAAYIHDDTASIVETAHDLLTRGAFDVDQKKTALVPAIYSLPALFGIPILPAVAAIQHGLGLLIILVVGLLVRAWFRHWRVFIIPVTILIAIHPVILWYEHVALAEIWSIFAALLVALFGWLLYRRPRPATLAGFLVSLLLIALARPEGNLFAFFGLALVVRAFWGHRTRCVIATSVTVCWSVLLFALTQTSQSGTLLYASVVHLTPDRLWFSPGVAEAVQPVATAATIQWRGPAVPRLVPIRKGLQTTVATLLLESGIPADQVSHKSNATMARAGIETTIRNATSMPAFAVQKFLIGHHELPALGFNTYSVEGQVESLFDDEGQPKNGLSYAGLTWGTTFAAPADARGYFTDNFREIPADWVWTWLQTFVTFSTRPILPITLPGATTTGVSIPGLPWLYTTALLGMIALAIRERHAFNYHVLLGLFLVAFFAIIMITANVRARFRVVFEPFWLLYAAALLDCLWTFVHTFLCSRSNHAQLPSTSGTPPTRPTT